MDPESGLQFLRGYEMSIEHRIRKAEEKLNMTDEPIVCEIVMFGGGPLPPERREGNRITRFISCSDLMARRQDDS